MAAGTKGKKLRTIREIIRSVPFEEGWRRSQWVWLLWEGTVEDDAVLVAGLACALSHYVILRAEMSDVSHRYIDYESIYLCHRLSQRLVSASSFSYHPAHCCRCRMI
jgi:hypothetical protein